MSLKDKAILVSLTVTKPKMTEKDRQATADVAVSNNASTAAVAVVKRLYPKHLLQPITEVESSARRYIESVTQPWARGLALLPCTLFMDFQKSVATFSLAYSQAVTVFLNNYANVMSEASREQGAMFDQTAYPDLSTLKADFSFGVKYFPLADVPSLALNLETSVLTELKAEIESQTKAQLGMGQAALYKRLGDAVQRIATQCGNDKGKIYDSLTGNLDEMLRVLPALNLSGDPAFAAICEQARELVVPSESIKTVPEVRQSLAAKANDILAQMGAFL